jgi:hypothetical protein
MDLLKIPLGTSSTSSWKNINRERREKVKKYIHGWYLIFAW